MKDSVLNTSKERFNEIQLPEKIDEIIMEAVNRGEINKKDTKVHFWAKSVVAATIVFIVFYGLFHFINLDKQHKSEIAVVSKVSTTDGKELTEFGRNTNQSSSEKVLDKKIKIGKSNKSATKVSSKPNVKTVLPKVAKSYIKERKVVSQINEKHKLQKEDNDKKEIAMNSINKKDLNMNIYNTKFKLNDKKIKNMDEEYKQNLIINNNSSTKPPQSSPPQDTTFALAPKSKYLERTNLSVQERINDLKNSSEIIVLGVAMGNTKSKKGQNIIKYKPTQIIKGSCSNTIDIVSTVKLKQAGSYILFLEKEQDSNDGTNYMINSNQLGVFKVEGSKVYNDDAEITEEIKYITDSSKDVDEVSAFINYILNQ